MIASCMKRQVISVAPDTTAEDAARLVVTHHVGTLPVVDEMGALVGIVRLQDLLQVFMPDFVMLLDNIDFIRSFGGRQVMTHRANAAEALHQEIGIEIRDLATLVAERLR